MSLADWGKLFLGIGLTAEALYELRRQQSTQREDGALFNGTNGLGFSTGSNYHRAALPRDTLPGEDQWVNGKVTAAKSVITRARQYTVRNIDERVAHIKQRINEDSLKPEIIEAARAIVSRKCGTRNGKRWCIEPKDYKNEVTAVYRAVQDANSNLALRYVRDHLKVDQFAAANKLIRLRGGDCDDGTILLGALLMAIGYPVKMRVIQDISSASWSHIYLLVGLPPTGPTTWVPLDWSVYPFKPPAWEAPGASKVAELGRPAGIVKAVKDYTV